MKTTEKLIKFVNQRPGLDFANYGDITSYRSEMRGITNDRSDFFELLSVAQRRLDGDLEQKLTKELENSNGRLTLNKKGDLEYCTGQYFPTEYRSAAARIIANVLWASYRDEKDTKGNPIYKDGIEIRKAIRRNLGRRAGKYFN